MKLGNIPQNLGLTKSNLQEGLKLGAGAALFPTLYGLLRGRMLLGMSSKYFAQGTWSEFLTRGVLALAAGHMAGKVKVLGTSVGDGMVASGLGSIASELISRYMSPAAAAQATAVQATETATAIDQVSGMNPLGRGLAGLGRLPAQSNDSMLFGVGGTDAGSMFSGSTVAIEENHGLAGATVAIEGDANLAGIFG